MMYRRARLGAGVLGLLAATSLSSRAEVPDAPPAAATNAPDIAASASAQAAAARTAPNGVAFTAFVKNLTDVYYWNNTFLTADTVSRYAELPRTYGVTVSYRY